MFLILLFFFSSVLQISLSSFWGTAHTWVNLPFVVGVAYIFLFPQGMSRIPYYVIGAGLVLDMFSAFPFGIIALSLFITFLFIRFVLVRAYKRRGMVLIGVAFAGSLLLGILERFFLILFGTNFFMLFPHLFSGEHIRFIMREAGVSTIFISSILLILFLGKKLASYRNVSFQ